MTKYYLFLDESGHHGLKVINREFPILLLCGCIFEQDYFDSQSCEGVELIAEARGKKEDSSLQNQYQITMSNGTSYVKSDRFEHMFLDFRFTKKKENHIGTQVCDLIAYPIANKILFPDKENFAFKVIEPKIYRQFPGGDYLGYGLKIFP